MPNVLTSTVLVTSRSTEEGTDTLSHFLFGNSATLEGLFGSGEGVRMPKWGAVMGA